MAKQNIVVATIKAINRDKGFHFFENLKQVNARAARAGYMSKDGRHAWFWIYDRDTETYKFYVFSGETGAIYKANGHANAGCDIEATEKVKRFCASYDNDRTMANATMFNVPKEVPAFNRENHAVH